MKMVLQFFADELLPFFGIKERAVRIVPTELIHMEIRKFYQDFNLEMEDGSWAHFEFQSTNEGLKGLKRFRSYEALASYQHNVAIKTGSKLLTKSHKMQTPFLQRILKKLRR